MTDENGLVPLTETELGELRNCERIVDEWRGRFVQVGQALTYICEKRLYKATHRTFDSYLRERWDISQQRATQYRLAAAISSVIRDAPTESGEVRVIVPSNERQARALSGLEPAQAVEVWDEAVRRCNGAQPTSQDVKKVLNAKLANPAKEKPSDRCTPAVVLDAVRRLFGGEIGLDAASDEACNRWVRARDFFSLEENGLTQQWYGRVFCSPPRGHGTHGAQEAAWIAKAIASVETGAAELVAFFCNADVGMQWFRRVWDYPVCLLHERLGFVDAGGQPTSSLAHGSALVLIVRDYTEWEAAFVTTFASLGTLVLPTDMSDLVNAWVAES